MALGLGMPNQAERRTTEKPSRLAMRSARSFSTSVSASLDTMSAALRSRARGNHDGPQLTLCVVQRSSDSHDGPPLHAESHLHLHGWLFLTTSPSHWTHLYSFTWHVGCSGVLAEKAHGPDTSGVSQGARLPLVT